MSGRTSNYYLRQMEQVPSGSTRGSGTIELAVVLRFVDIAVDALAEAREEIDALNVYPVPDGDTGTNMYLTVAAARDALREATARGSRPPRAAWPRCARAHCSGRRGNSGVILSQMLGALATTIAGAPARSATPASWRGPCARRPTVRTPRSDTPVEGTILTVVRAAADAAEERAAEPGARARDVFTAAAAAAREALAHTPEQLAVLRDAGVVDAGGRGLSVILDAAETVLTGRRPIPVTAPIGARRDPGPVAQPAEDLTADGPAYEVMYLLDADDDRGAGAQGALARPGRLARRGRRRRPLERARARRRRRRRGRGRHRRGPAAPDPGDPLRRAGRRSPREAGLAARGRRTHRPPGRRRGRRAGLAKLFEEAGARWSSADPATARRPA